MLANEREHFAIFSKIMEKRSIRHCYALRCWAIGGCLLGLVTAMFGRNAIWVCTNSIETTVLHHLKWQLAFLQQHDTEVYNAVLSIKSDEEQHQESGRANGTESIIYTPIFWLVRKSTELAIWLSTKL
jgi:ubiquinone biosynthesis monooxygenase Coq7